MALSSGTQLGPYEILKPIGAGGMGEVYKAQDSRLHRTVAIKVLPEHVSNTPELKARLEREARTLASLSHPHICPVFDVGQQDGIDYLVMEFLEGKTVAERLQKGPLPIDEALKIAVEIADALDKAHRLGVVHRDLKPSNIMLTKSGAKLLDFGLAKLKQDAKASTLSELPTNAAVTAPKLILEHESDGHLSLLPRLRGLDSTECIRAHVRLIGGAQTSEIVAPQYVEDLPDEFELSRFAQSNRLADPEIQPREQTAVDLAFGDRSQAERCAISVHSRQHGGGVSIPHVLRRSRHVVGVGAITIEVDARLGAEGGRRPDIPDRPNNDLTGQLPAAAEYEFMPAIGVGRTDIEAPIVEIGDHASKADPYQVGGSKVAILLRKSVGDLVLVIV